MAPDVKQAFVDLFCKRTGASAADGKAWLAGLVANHRYLEDIWASSRGHRALVSAEFATAGPTRLRQHASIIYLKKDSAGRARAVSWTENNRTRLEPRRTR